MWLRPLVLLLALFSASLASRSVTIQNGTVVGFPVTAGSNKAWQFLGIPFAEKPVGRRRFAKPQPLQKGWAKPLIANKAPNRCPQAPNALLIDSKVDKALVAPFNEDCLYLNIWTPQNTSRPKAVMVWLHGGYYIFGEGLPTYHGAPLAALHDVIVITAHYRLGALGFLRLGSAVSGNWGMFDQQAAFRWVQENIAAFGGDPKRVTIFGESAGASSSALHLLSPQSAPLFRRVIAQSGALASWAFSPRAADVADEHRQFAAALDCLQPDPLECLRTKPAQEVLAKQASFRWMPVVDGDFLLADPRTLKAAKKDVIMGVNEDEGGMLTELMSIWASTHIPATNQDKFLEEQVLAQLPYYPDKTSPLVKVAATPLYRSYVDSKNRTLNRIRINRAFGDAAIVCPVNQFVDRLERQGCAPFVYLFGHRSSFSPFPPYVGATHGDEMAYMFQFHISYPHLVPMTSAERALSTKMARDWTNFAKTGRPASKGWRRFSTAKKEFFEFGLPGGPKEGGIHRDDCGFWTEAIPKLQEAGRTCGDHHGMRGKLGDAAAKIGFVTYS